MSHENNTDDSRIVGFGIGRSCAVSDVHLAAQSRGHRQPRLPPDTNLSQDSAGNLYGTTANGGSENAGVIYKVSLAGEQTVLYNLPLGAIPSSGVILDGSGNLYGTTTAQVYELSPAGAYTALHTFHGPPDGSEPGSGLFRDPAGNLYGTTSGGGVNNKGILFKLSPSGVETILHNFGAKNLGYTDGYAAGAVILDSSGNIYGSTALGGSSAQSTVWEFSSTGVYSQLFGFPGAYKSGAEPGAVVRDSAGNLYGVTRLYGGDNDGSLFKIETSGDEVVLYRFPSGYGPSSSVVLDAAGNLYGTTLGNQPNSLGRRRRFSPSQVRTDLHRTLPF